MDLYAAVRRTIERSGLVHPIVLPPLVIFSDPIERFLDATSTPLSSREIRALSSYKGGIFKRVHPTVLDENPTVEDMIRRPTMFASALMVVRTTLGERGRSKIRDFMAPLFGPDFDPDLEEIFDEYVDSMSKDVGAREAASRRFAYRLSPIACGADPRRAIVALMGIVQAQRTFVTNRDEIALSRDQLDLTKLAECHRVATTAQMSYLAGASAPLMDATARDSQRKQALEHFESVVRTDAFEEQLRKTFGRKSLRSIASDPSFYARIEDARNSGPIRRIGEFGRRVVLFEVFASMKERREFVRSLVDLAIVSHGTAIEDAFENVLRSGISGGIPVSLSYSCIWFVKWYSVYDPASATVVAARLDASLRTDVVSTYIAGNLVSPADPERNAAPAEPETVEGEETVFGEAEDPNETIAPDFPAASEISPDPRTEREIAAASEWEIENSRLADLISDMAISLTDVASARLTLDRMDENVRRLGDILREAEDARRPVDAAAILSRLRAIATTVAQALSSDAAPVPVAGTLDPRMIGRTEDGTTRGEAAGEAAARASEVAGDIYGKLSGARLSERGRLASEYADLIDVVHAHGGRALEAVEDVVSLIFPTDMPTKDGTATDEPESTVDPEPAVDERSEPLSSTDRTISTDPSDRPMTAAAELVRDTIRRHGIRGGIVDARYHPDSETGPFATVVLEAMLHPGHLATARYADRDVRDTFELASIHLSDHPRAEHGEMAGLLSVAALEGATFAPSDVYSAILDHGEKGRLGTIAHALRQPILEVVARIGLPTEETFASVSQILSVESPAEVASRVAEAVRSSRFTYKAADRVRDRLCSREGFLGRAEARLSSGVSEDVVVEMARRLATKKDASTHLDAIARELRVDRLFSSGRLKLQEAIVEVASTILARERAAATSGPSDAHVVKLAVAADAAFLSAKDIVRFERDDFHESLAKHALKILGRYADLVNGRAPGLTKAKYQD